MTVFLRRYSISFHHHFLCPVTTEVPENPFSPSWFLSLKMIVLYTSPNSSVCTNSPSILEWHLAPLVELSD